MEWNIFRRRRKGPIFFTAKGVARLIKTNTFAIINLVGLKYFTDFETSFRIKVINEKPIRPNRIFILLFLISLGEMAASKSTFAQTPEIFGGAAQIEITPQESGYPHYRGASTGTHDPLFAKAMVLMEGDEKFAILVCDLLWIERDLSIKVRTKIEADMGIPYHNIIVSATHTHTGPAYHPNIRELTGKLRIPFDTINTTGENDSYPTWLAEKMVEAVSKAHDNAVPVMLESGSGLVDDIAFNRRFLMKDGKMTTNPGVMNPQISRTTGPVDPVFEILLLRKKSDNRPIAGLSNFAVHADTFGGTAFSADYPGFLAKGLASMYGDQFVSVFAAGACGNINHVDVSGSIPRPSSEVIGKALAQAVEPDQLKALGIGKFESLSSIVYAPLQHFTQKELEWAHQEEAPPLYVESAFLERRRRLKIRSLERMRRTEAIPPTIGERPWKIPLEVQVFRIGNEFAIVGVPGEVFVELGLAIKEKSPFKQTLVIELTNCHIAYVPTMEAFSGGGYETVNSRLAPGGGELLVKTAIKMLEELGKSN